MPENTIDVLGVRVTDLPLTELLQRIRAALAAKTRLAIGNVNVYAMNLVERDPHFAETLNTFDIVFCDGYGVMLGSALLGRRIHHRYTPPDFVDEVMQSVVETGGSVFLLGARPGLAEKAAQALQARTPGLRVAGCHHGYFDKSAGQENDEVIAEINRSGATLLLVAFGMPSQEQWLMANWSGLNVSVALTVGALLDTLAGAVPRGPRLLTDHGFEWLSRLVIEPRRLWKRYLLGIPRFFWSICKARLSGK